MKLTANFRPLPSGYNMTNMFTRAQLEFISLDGSDMFINIGGAVAGGINGLSLTNTIGIRTDFILPTNTIELSLGTWVGADVTVNTIDVSGVKLTHTLSCDHTFVTHTISGLAFQTIEFEPRAETCLEYISIDVNFCK